MFRFGFRYLLFLMLGFWPASGFSQDLCFDIFSQPELPAILHCADTDYFADVNGGLISLGGSHHHESQASFDGIGLFDPSATGVSSGASIVAPFSSSARLGVVKDVAGNITEIDVKHRGIASILSAESGFQSAAYQTRSRVTFVPVNTVDPSAPVVLDIKIDFPFRLVDPPDNVTKGAALGGMGLNVKVEGDASQASIDLFGVAELDLATDVDPSIFGFDQPANSAVEITSEPAVDVDGAFDINVGMEIEFSGGANSPILAGAEIVLNADVYGSVFTDGFESGDVFSWSASSLDGMSIVVSSLDPNVRFELSGVATEPLFGDCNFDGKIDAADLSCVSTIAERDVVLVALNSWPGDLEGNEDVGFNDFLILANNFGKNPARYDEGNIDLENGVAFNDFLSLATHFGRTQRDVAAVPEPGSFGFGLIMLLLPLIARRNVLSKP